ncbi:MAG: hypothetical protein HOE26_00055, partial [Rhodospirillaceae bacterium]|nr:hypothetical protein [Rhodospirillaceae bacterium]
MTAPTISYLQWFARQLAQAGLRRAFGVPGGGTSLDLMSALHDQGIETVITAREDAAVIMAGVSGLLAGGPGLAFTTRGPGLASALNGLASAALDRLPALVISEDFDAADLDYMSHQVLPQSSLVAPILSQGHGGELAASPAALEGWLATGGSTELPAP